MRCFLLLFWWKNLWYVVNYFIVATLQEISKKYNLSERVTGYILAVGTSIPEFTTNLISATTTDGNINIGVGNIAGSGAYGSYFLLFRLYIVLWYCLFFCDLWRVASE